MRIKYDGGCIRLSTLLTKRLKLRSRIWELGLPWRLHGKESACQCKDAAPIPAWGRSPGGGYGSPLQSCLEIPMDGGAWWAIVRGVMKESDPT